MGEVIAIPPITRGSDITVSVTLSDDDGVINLTGATLSFFDVRTELDGLLTGEITDASNGVVEIKIEGTSPINVGVYRFRVQLNFPDGGDTTSIGLPMFRIEVV